MKKVILVITIAFLSNAAFSQLRKGQWIVGGDGTYSNSVTKQNNDFFRSENKTTNVDVTPGVGYFIIDQLAAGIRPGYGYANVKAETQSGGATQTYSLVKSKISGFSISPFVRYYALPSGRKLNVFADLSYSYSQNKENTTVDQVFIPPGGLPSVTRSTNSGKVKGHSYSVAVGPAFFMNPKVSLELAAGYSFTKFDGNTNQKANTFLLGAGFQIHLGK